MHSYCIDLVRQQNCDAFLQSLFVREPTRTALLALYSLNAELAQIKDKTSEELIGQVRLAWWQEAIESIYAGQPSREQPVLQALAPLIAAGQLPKDPLIMLLNSYREHFPALPDVKAKMDALALTLLRALSPQSEAAWHKAKSIINRHRQCYGNGKKGWLNLKLLLAGL